MVGKKVTIEDQDHQTSSNAQSEHVQPAAQQKFKFVSFMLFFV